VAPLQDYALALAALESPEPLEQTSVLAILLNRDSVARFLEKQDSVNLSDMLKLVELDRNKPSGHQRNRHFRSTSTNGAYIRPSGLRPNGVTK